MAAYCTAKNDARHKGCRQEDGWPVPGLMGVAAAVDRMRCASPDLQVCMRLLGEVQAAGVMVFNASTRIVRFHVPSC